jgi:hypothetical protein
MMPSDSRAAPRLFRHRPQIAPRLSLPALLLLTTCSAPTPRPEAERNVRVGASRAAPGTKAKGSSAAGEAKGAGELLYDLEAVPAAGSSQREDGRGTLTLSASIDRDGHSLGLTITSQALFSGTTEILEVRDGRAAKMRTTYDKLQISMELRAVIDGQERVQQLPSSALPLQGEVVISELKGDFYHRRLESGAPTAEQAEMLKEPRPVITQYAGKPVGVGATWTLQGEALQALAGGMLSDPTGRVTGRLVQVQPCDSHSCGLVTFSGQLRGELPIGVVPDGLQWQMEGSCRRDLTRSIDAACHTGGPLTGRMQLDADVAMDAEGTLEFDWQERGTEGL